MFSLAIKPMLLNWDAYNAEVGYSVNNKHAERVFSRVLIAISIYVTTCLGRFCYMNARPTCYTYGPFKPISDFKCNNTTVSDRLQMFTETKVQ